MGPGLSVIVGGVRAQLRHLAEHRDVAARGRERGQVIERRAHGDRVGVVAVVHDDDSVGQLDQLAAQAREGYPRRPLRHLIQWHLERLADRDRRQGVGEVVRLAEREREALLAGRRADRGLDRAPVAAPLQGEHVAPGAEGDRHQPVVQVGLERLGVGGDDGAIALAELGEDLGLGLGDRLQGAQELQVDGADVGDRRDVRLRDLAQLGDLPAAPHRHLQHQRLRLGRGTEHGQWQADLGVVVLRAGMDAQGQDRVADVLDRRLAHRPRDPDDPAPELAPPGPSERLQRGERIGRGQHPAATVFRPALGRGARQGARALRLDHDAPGSGLERPRGELAPVGVLARQAEEQIPGAQLARVDDCPLRPPARAGDRDLGAGRGGDAVCRQLDHARDAALCGPTSDVIPRTRCGASAAPPWPPRGRRTGSSARPRIPAPARDPCRR